MGSSTSTVHPGFLSIKPNRAQSIKKEDLIETSLPCYYTTDLPSPDDYTQVNAIWNLIVTDKAPNYLEMKASGKLPFNQSCLVAFYDIYFNRLFEVMPGSKEMFTRGMKGQSSALLKMIGILLKDVDAVEQLKIVLIKIVDVHFMRGIHSKDYGTVGDVIFYSFKEVLGATIYNEEIHMAWVRVFSRKLTLMVPYAVSLELAPTSISATADSSTYHAGELSPNKQRSISPKRNISPSRVGSPRVLTTLNSASSRKRDETPS